MAVCSVCKRQFASHAVRPAGGGPIVCEACHAKQAKGTPLPAGASSSAVSTHSATFTNTSNRQILIGGHRGNHPGGANLSSSSSSSSNPFSSSPRKLPAVQTPPPTSTSTATSTATPAGAFLH